MSKMSELFSQLGINWKLLLSQGVNFFIVLAVLTIFVWRPLLALMAERRKKIEAGLEDAKVASEKLAGADELVKGRLTEADREAVVVIQKAEKVAIEKAATLVSIADKKAETLLEEARRVAAQREQEEFQKFAMGAGALLRTAIAKAVAENPQKIDEKLIADAAAFIKKQRV